MTRRRPINLVVKTEDLPATGMGGEEESTLAVPVAPESVQPGEKDNYLHKFQPLLYSEESDPILSPEQCEGSLSTRTMRAVQ